MLEWLGGWLKEIVAIILLAAFIDLLLPNKAMQRYVRLVVGLIILLALLSPLLRLIQGDIGSRLAAGVRIWNESDAESDVRMPSLDAIREDAGRLRTGRELQAASLTEERLAEAMKAEIVRRTGAPVAEVSVRLEKEEVRDDVPNAIASVTVTLQGERAPEAGAAGDEIGPVEEIAPVIVDVDVESEEKVSGSPDGSDPLEAEPEAEAAWAPAGPAAAKSIRSVLESGWGVLPDQVYVRVPSDSGAR